MELKDSTLLALLDALAIISKLRREISLGPMCPWLMLEHAAQYLEKQITAIMRSEP